VLSCHACPTREWVSDALLWQCTPQPPAFNAAGGLASGRRLVPVGHVAVPDPGVGGRAHRGTWWFRTPAQAGSEGPEVGPVGHVAAPDPGVGGRAHRGLRRFRTPAQAGSGGPEVGSVGHVAPPDPAPAVYWFYARGRSGQMRGGPGPIWGGPSPRLLARSFPSSGTRGVTGPVPRAGNGSGAVGLVR